MVDNLTNMLQREWNSMNNDANNVNNSVSNSRLLHPHLLSRKISDHDNNNSNNSQHQHQPSIQSTPMITTTDYSDPSSLSVMRVPQGLFNRKSSDAGYDTDGGIGTFESISKHHHHKNSHSYEHLASPRLASRRAMADTLKQLPVVPFRRYPSQQAHLSVNPSSGIPQNYDDKDEKPVHEGNARRHHIRLSRRIHRPSPSTKNHGAHVPHSPTIAHHKAVLATTSSERPLRLVFIRHSERANQALGPDWFSKAFRTNVYKAYNENLPIMLPKRRFDQAYEFDTPLTVRGLKTARHTGRVMLSTNLIADVCLSSTALRCIQTAERILTGMDRRDRIPIRIEPGLFECPHLKQKIVDSFMTKKELVENGYNIKLEYKPLIQKVNVPETLDEYFDRCVTVMRGIIDRYGHHGSTVLIVTHAPGLLALTDAIKGKRPNHETFYRTVASYPPLATYIAEYDGTKWKYSEQPSVITPLEQ